MSPSDLRLEELNDSNETTTLVIIVDLSFWMV